MKERDEAPPRGKEREDFSPGQGKPRAADPRRQTSAGSNGPARRPGLDGRTSGGKGDLPLEMVAIYRLYGIPLDYRSGLLD